MERGIVGYHVARYCHEAGATLIVTDVMTEPLEQAATEFDAEVVNTDRIYEVECGARLVAGTSPGKISEPIRTTWR